MKHYAPVLLSLLLSHCSLGTEVGNGVAPPQSDKNGQTHDSAAPEANEVSTGAPGNVSSLVLSSAFFAACASPFAELIEGNFAPNQAASPLFKVVINEKGLRLVTQINAGILYSIQPARSISDYAIEPLVNSPKVTCSAIISQTRDDGAVERLVTLSSGVVVSWILKEGSLISMKAAPTNLTEEIWLKISE